MAFAQEQREALYLLQSIEEGTLPVADVRNLIEEADPALVYLIFTWIRNRYGAGHPAAEGVIGRLVELTSSYNSVNAKITEGKADPIVTWFEEVHNYRDLSASDFIELVVEKLEG